MRRLAAAIVLFGITQIIAGQNSAPSTSPASAPVNATATATALPELITPEGALHELLTAMFMGDQTRINHATIDVPGREVLSQGTKVPEAMLSQIDRVIEGMHLQRLKVGDSIKVKTVSSPEGVTVVMDENRINENRTEITGPALPYPFILVKDGKEWKVDPTPLIASRKAAAQARAATQTKPAETAPATKP
jgi:hypothetical protein